MKDENKEIEATTSSEVTDVTQNKASLAVSSTAAKLSADSTEATEGANTTEPEHALNQLTAKNSDYIHSVTKQLMLAGRTDAEVKAILAEIIPQILEAQKDGTTARTLLGTPTELVTSYGNKSPQKAGDKSYNSNPLLMITDNFLLILALLSVLSGLMSFASNGVTPYKLTTLILSSIIGGWAMYMIWKLIYAPSAKEKPRKGRAFLIAAGVMLLWFVVTFASLILPTINLSGTYQLVMGIAVFSFRYWFKTKFNIQPSMPRQTAR